MENNRDDSELLPTRLNQEPPVFRGCSLSELVTLAGISAVILIPLCIIVMTLFGYPMMGIGIGSLSVIGGVVGGATQLQAMKRGRPDGYYQLQIALVLNRLGIKKAGLITRGGHWGIGRTKDARSIIRKIQK